MCFYGKSIENKIFKIFVILTEKFIRNDEKMIDPDFVQGHSGKVPEGKGDLNLHDFRCIPMGKSIEKSIVM